MANKGGHKLTVLVSGTGTIMASMIRKKIPIELVIADRDCKGLGIAAKHKIAVVLVDRRIYGWNPKKPGNFNRDKFCIEITKHLNERRITIVAMAGFMTILSQKFFDNFKGIVLNTHPALLPSFPGAHATRDAINYGVKVSGCTIHMVTPKVDEGKILAQEVVKVLPDDTEESLQERIKKKERVLYPKVLKKALLS